MSSFVLSGLMSSCPVMSCLVSSFFYLLFSSFLLFVSSHAYLLFHLFFYLISKLTSQLFFILSHCIFSSDLQLMHLTCKFFQALEDKQGELENYKSALSSAKAQYQQTREALQRSKEAEVSNKLCLLIYFTLFEKYGASYTGLKLLP